MTSVFSWQNSISLCPASFCTPKPNLPVTPGISWLPTFVFQFPLMKRMSFLGVSSKRCCRSSQNCLTLASSVLLVGAQIWITVILAQVLNDSEAYCSHLTLFISRNRFYPEYLLSRKRPSHISLLFFSYLPQRVFIN